MNYKPIILFRSSLGFENEMKIAKNYFPVYEHRASIPKHSLVIPRYSALPFYRELDQDVRLLDSKLINSPEEHEYVANLSQWYLDLEGQTPRTWFQLHEIPDRGPFVLKGNTNSRKFSWDTHMFAEDKKTAIQVYGRLLEDGLVGEQDIVVRKWEPLRQLTTAPRGLPICEEYRFFVLDGKILSGGFYWSSHVEDLDETYSADRVPRPWLDSVIHRVASNVRFFVIDVARTATGWTVIELNDGQMSGLSENDPHTLYSALKSSLNCL